MDLLQPNQIATMIIDRGDHAIDDSKQIIKHHNAVLAMLLMRLRVSLRHVQEDVDDDYHLRAVFSALGEIERVHVAHDELTSRINFPTKEAFTNISELAFKQIDGYLAAIAKETQNTAAAINQVSDLHSEKQQLKQKLSRLCEHSQSHPEFRQRVWDACGGACFYCDVKLVWSNPELTTSCDPRHVFHMDHIVPKNSGGPDHIHNFVASCAGCNMAKADKSFVEFYRTRKRPELRVVAGVDAGVTATG